MDFSTALTFPRSACARNRAACGIAENLANADSLAPRHGEPIAADPRMTPTSTAS
jgi:hypothetical protein